MSCPICEKESNKKLLEHLPPLARSLCFQCQKNAKSSVRLAERLRGDKLLLKRIDKKVTFIDRYAAHIFYIDNYTLSKKEFLFLEELFLSNFSGYMNKLWPELKLKRIRKNKTCYSGDESITGLQFNNYLIKKLNQVAKKKEGAKVNTKKNNNRVTL